MFVIVGMFDCDDRRRSSSAFNGRRQGSTASGLSSSTHEAFNASVEPHGVQGEHEDKKDERNEGTVGGVEAVGRIIRDA